MASATWVSDRWRARSWATRPDQVPGSGQAVQRPQVQPQDLPRRAIDRRVGQQPGQLGPALTGHRCPPARPSPAPPRTRATGPARLGGPGGRSPRPNGAGRSPAGSTRRSPSTRTRRPRCLPPGSATRRRGPWPRSCSRRAAPPPPDVLMRQPQQRAGKNPFLSGTGHAGGHPFGEAPALRRWSRRAGTRGRWPGWTAENGPYWPSTSWRRRALRSAAEVEVSPHGLVAPVELRPSSCSSLAMPATPPTEDQSAFAEGSSEVRIMGPMSARSEELNGRPARCARSSTPAMISILSTLAVVIRRSERYRCWQPVRESYTAALMRLPGQRARTAASKPAVNGEARAACRAGNRRGRRMQRPGGHVLRAARPSPPTPALASRACPHGASSSLTDERQRRQAISPAGPPPGRRLERSPW